MIFDLLEDHELIGLIPEDKLMDREKQASKKRLSETGKKRARFVEDDSIGKCNCFCL